MSGVLVTACPSPAPAHSSSPERFFMSGVLVTALPLPCPRPFLLPSPCQVVWPPLRWPMLLRCQPPRFGVPLVYAVDRCLCTGWALRHPVNFCYRVCPSFYRPLTPLLGSVCCPLPGVFLCFFMFDSRPESVTLSRTTYALDPTRGWAVG